MRKAEQAIMWTGAIILLLFSVIQTVAAIIRGEWFYTFCFTIMVAISMSLIQTLGAEARKEANDERN